MIDLKEIASRIADFINNNGGSVLPNDITLAQLSELCLCIDVRPAIEIVARDVNEITKPPLTDIERAAIALLDAIDMKPDGGNIAPSAEHPRWSNRVYGPCVRELKRLVTETTGVPYK